MTQNTIADSIVKEKNTLHAKQDEYTNESTKSTVDYNRLYHIAQDIKKLKVHVDQLIRDYEMEYTQGYSSPEYMHTSSSIIIDNVNDNVSGDILYMLNNNQEVSSYKMQQAVQSIDRHRDNTILRLWRIERYNAYKSIPKDTHNVVHVVSNHMDRRAAVDFIVDNKVAVASFTYFGREEDSGSMLQARIMLAKFYCYLNGLNTLWMVTCINGNITTQTIHVDYDNMNTLHKKYDTLVDSLEDRTVDYCMKITNTKKHKDFHTAWVGTKPDNNTLEKLTTPDDAYEYYKQNMPFGKKDVMVIDLETTDGLTPKNGASIIESGIVIYHVDGSTSSLSERHGIDTTDLELNGTGYQDLHGIYPEDIYNKKKFHDSDAYHVIMLHINNGGILIAHNANFEKRFLQAEGIPVDNSILVDSMYISAHMDGHHDAVDHNSNTLEDYCYRHDVDYVNAHNAIHDADMTMCAVLNHFDVEL